MQFIRVAFFVSTAKNLVSLGSPAGDYAVLWKKMFLAKSWKSAVPSQ